MKVLIIEDDPNKSLQIRNFLVGLMASVEIEERRSYQSGLLAALHEQVDIVLLDMSLPTYDISSSEPGGRPRPFAGREILEELDRKRRDCHVIVVTQFETFGQGDEQTTLEAITNDLRLRFPRLFVGAVFYQPSDLKWQQRLVKALGSAERRNDQNPHSG
jgi:DNA-binding NarL/FixJ family response regulator